MLLSIHGLWKFELFWAYPNESNNKKWSKRFLKGLLVNQNTNCYTQESIKKNTATLVWIPGYSGRKYRASALVCEKVGIAK